jgi:hypothetical protein
VLPYTAETFKRVTGVRPVDALYKLAVRFAGLLGMPGSKNQLMREPAIGRKLVNSVVLRGRPHRNASSTTWTRIEPETVTPF